MDNNFQQEIDSVEGSNQQKLEDAKQTLAYTKVYAYRLYKPTCFDIDKPRFENIVVGDDVRSFFRVHEDMEGCYNEFDAFKDKLELSMENSVETNDEQTFERTLKRRIMSIANDISFLDEGNWIFSFDEPVNKNTDFTKCWVFSANQQEVGYVSWEPDAKIFEFGDERNPARDYEKSLIMVSMDTFKNLNGYSLSIQYGMPTVIGEDYNLTKLKFNGQIYKSLFNQIELRTLDNKSFLTNKTLLTKKAPMILNTIENQQIVKFNNLWALPSVLDLSIVKQIMENNDLDELLKLPAVGIGEDKYKGKGKILQADLQLTPNFDNAEWYNADYKMSGNKTQIMSQATSVPKKFEITEFNENMGIGDIGNMETYRAFHPFKKDKIWKYWPNNPTEYKSWPANNSTGLQNNGDYYNTRNNIGTIRIQKEDGTIEVFQNAQIQKAKLKFRIREYYQDGTQDFINKSMPFTNKETLFFAWGYTVKDGNLNTMGLGLGIPRELPNTDGYKYYMDFINSSNNLGVDGIHKSINTPGMSRTGRFQMKMGWDDEYQDIHITGAYSTNTNRLSDLLKKIITFTNAYKTGFPQAKFSSLGNPLNFMAKVKDKFLNSNYAPQQVITNLVEDYKMRNPKDLETEQWSIFLKLIPMLGNYILSDYCISGGLNDQHQILFPWYFELENSLTKYVEWIDDENRKEDLEITKTNILIDGTSLPFLEQGEITEIDSQKYTLQNISCIHQASLKVNLKSKWFDLENFNFDNIISSQPSYNTSQVSRVFKEINSDLKESDISTIPVDMSLSDDYISNIFNVLLREEEEVQNYLQQFIGTGATENWDENSLKEMIEIVKNLDEESKTKNHKDIVDGDENEEITINVDNFDFDIPALLSFKGLFGNNFDVKFVWEKSEIDENGNTIIIDTVEYELNTDVFNKNDNRVISTKLYL